ncbi:hypothetical protein GZ77_23780 [Endozoicomonas montiporae]|uniref:DUF2232 domain-containing protein n=2 Tax=Endozoicomonas montiporae TaxID=1027273 RepID=A0A081MZC6_9GAMM|nr:hypothetical protein [Endozoicomonas montiporae]AMO54766.1 hypothetical protein EZMO1_0516 [Endozoicomonas montiporae CL-33]KEQ11549.1 hypothetical protein GZ77_23780 [Endozoicomonas montiporae]
MRGLANYAMRGPKQALFMAVLFASIPMLFWLSSAIIALVILRRGIDHGLKVLMWALLPAIGWAAAGQFNVLTGLLATTLLACTLRQTVSWPKTLLALVPVGGAIALSLFQLAPQQIALLSEAVMSLLVKILPEQGAKSTVDIGTQLKPLVEYGVIGMLAWFTLVSGVLSLVLARAWQSVLYNPGGFGNEFRRVILPPVASIVLLALTLGGSALSPVLTALIPIASLPLFIAGIALVHGLVNLKQLGSFWLVGMYMLLILVTQLAYPVIVLTACFDSVFDFRRRAANRIAQNGPK